MATGYILVSDRDDGQHSRMGGKQLFLCGPAYVSPQSVPSYTRTIPETGYTPNGNVSHLQDSVNGDAVYSYDSLDRLQLGTLTPPGGATSFLCWSYDSFGNRTNQMTSSAPITVASDGTCTTPSTATYSVNVLAFNDGSNRITSTGLSKLTVPTDYYESDSGNVQNDGSYHYLYDDDGRLCAIVNPTPAVGSVSGTSYIYDADGRRVAKGSITQATCDRTAPGFQLTNTYILDQSGQQVSEVDGQGNWQHTNVYLGAQLLATYDPQGLHFSITDPLGTRRVQTSGTGQVEQNCKSLPFGDSDSCFALGTPTSPTEHLFTGKERDAESGLDYFGSRYYSSSMGRFSTADPSGLAYADQTNPQSYKLYSYALNNPLRLVDPNGLTSRFFGGAGDTTNNDHDPSDYADSGTAQHCLDTGGQILSENASVDVNADGSGAGDVTTSGGGSTALIDFWNVPNPGGCSAGLAYAKKDQAGVGRANAASGGINSASTNTIPPALLDAIGMEETDFSNVQERVQGGGAGPGMGVFQLTNQPGVSRDQAFSVPFSANYTAKSLSKNMAFLAAKFSGFIPTQLLQATAASHNIGRGGISGNPATIDNGTNGTPPGHYGASVIGLMNCFGGG